SCQRPLGTSAYGFYLHPCQLSLTYCLSIHSCELGNYVLPLLLQQRQSWGRRGFPTREH
uniref:Uncharacterized protein n=1 Tax=Amphimedon queenslandica TaxID=400682 RepID=A0A1X7V5U3_AMPQE